MDLEAINKWHKTRQGYVAFGVAELALAYLFASLAIDSGSLIQYAIAIILVFAGFQNLVNIFRVNKNEHKKH